MKALKMNTKLKHKKSNQVVYFIDMVSKTEFRCSTGLKQYRMTFLTLELKDFILAD